MRCQHLSILLLITSLYQSNQIAVIRDRPVLVRIIQIYQQTHSAVVRHRRLDQLCRKHLTGHVVRHRMKFIITDKIFIRRFMIPRLHADLLTPFCISLHLFNIRSTHILKKRIDHADLQRFANKPFLPHP